MNTNPLKRFRGAVRCLAVATFAAGLISGSISLWYALADVGSALFTSGMTPIKPTAGEIVRDAMLSLFQPMVLLATAAVLWLLADIHEAICSRAETASCSRDA